MNSIRPRISTDLPTGAGTVPHSRTDSGACRIEDSARTSTGQRDTAARKSQTQQWVSERSSEPARLSDPGSQSLFEGRGDTEAGPQAPDPSAPRRRDHGEPGRDRRRRVPTTRPTRPGAARRPADAAGFARRRRSEIGSDARVPTRIFASEKARPEPERPGPTRTWRGDVIKVRLRVRQGSRPLAQFRLRPCDKPPRKLSHGADRQNLARRPP